MDYHSFKVRQKLGAEIVREVEPELEGSLQSGQAHGIQPVRAPLVRKKGGAICAAQTPGGQCLAAAVRARQYGSSKRWAVLRQNPVSRDRKYRGSWCSVESRPKARTAWIPEQATVEANRLP